MCCDSHVVLKSMRTNTSHAWNRVLRAKLLVSTNPSKVEELNQDCFVYESTGSCRNITLVSENIMVFLFNWLSSSDKKSNLGDI